MMPDLMDLRNVNVTFAISSPAIEPSGRTDCTIERIGSGTNDLTVDGPALVSAN